ncbi:hypothetical protein ILUMI_23639 [Ignelater luminosus]|uniref:Uncharacterized protein n=1 Tax=Ignelater luminosus TaxID=2038154 RepID=A0A8K0FWU8_IGNLU|nr:hypothetical protein ILUMI_23639 [Ignelater luminosus]
MINDVIERNKSMKVLRPNLCKNIITIKDKNEEEIRDKSKIEKRVQEFHSELYQTRQHPSRENKNQIRKESIKYKFRRHCRNNHGGNTQRIKRNEKQQSPW